MFKIQARAGVAQSVEQGTENPRVSGSIPLPGTSFHVLIPVAAYLSLSEQSEPRYVSFTSRPGGTPAKKAKPSHRDHDHGVGSGLSSARRGSRRSTAPTLESHQRKRRDLATSDLRIAARILYSFYCEQPFHDPERLDRAAAAACHPFYPHRAWVQVSG